MKTPKDGGGVMKKCDIGKICLALVAALGWFLAAGLWLNEAHAWSKLNLCEEKLKDAGETLDKFENSRISIGFGPNEFMAKENLRMRHYVSVSPSFEGISIFETIPENHYVAIKVER